MEVLRKEFDTEVGRVVYEARYAFNQTIEVTMTTYPKEPIKVSDGWVLSSPIKMSTILETSNPELAISAMMFLMAETFSDTKPLDGCVEGVVGIEAT